MWGRISKATTRNTEVEYINSKSIKRIGKNRIRKETDPIKPRVWVEVKKERKKP